MKNSRAIAIFAPLLLASGCTHLPFEAGGAMPPLAPLARAAAALETPEFPSWGFRISGPGADDSETIRHERFLFTTYDDAAGKCVVVAGEIYLPVAGEAGRRFPLIASSPILGGAQSDYFDCRVFGRWACAEGFASYFLYQDEILLLPSSGAIAIERTLESWVEAMRKALAALLARYPLDAARLGTFGVSLGGIRTVILAAREPRFRANVVCLAGADLAAVVADSGESLVERYLARRSEALLAPPEAVVADWRANMHADPLLVAGAIAPESALLFLARFDDKVPAAAGWRLYEALGRPETRISPLGHYTSILLLPWAARHSFRFYARRFAEAEPPESAPGR
ncbi:MAG: hypothetical protein L0Z55_06090 [Planctomycetes bacterium]|nr:hypothetical protein [Planctomycetota bacterium]